MMYKDWNQLMLSEDGEFVYLSDETKKEQYNSFLRNQGIKKLKNCPYCENGKIESEDEDCIFCDGDGCKLCAGNNGKTTIVWCTGENCILSDDDDD